MLCEFMNKLDLMPRFTFDYFGGLLLRLIEEDTVSVTKEVILCF